MKNPPPIPRLAAAVLDDYGFTSDEIDQRFIGEAALGYIRHSRESGNPESPNNVILAKAGTR